MKGHWSPVNLVKREALLKDLLATSVLPFPNTNKKVYINPYIYAKAMEKPLVEKINVNFSVTWPVSFIGKYLPQISYASLQANAMELLILILKFFFSF